MSTRGRRGRGGSQTTRRVYEDFKPAFRWQEDNDNHILVIDLPGFVTRQVKVSTEDQNIIRVHGERLITQERGSRFQKDFQVPAGGDMNKVQAKLEQGELIITIAKKKVDKPQGAPPAKATGTEIPKQPVAQLGRDEHPPTVEPSQPGDEKSLELTLGARSTPPHQPDIPKEGRKGTPFRDAGKVPPQDYEITELKEKHATVKTVESEKKTSQRSKELLEAGTAEKAKLETGNGDTATAAEKENNGESKRKHKLHRNGADTGVSATEKYEKVVKKHTELNEDRQLLVNMGAAMLVIMALSAYVTYQFASGKDKN